MTNGRAMYRLLAPRCFWLLLGVILLIEAIYVTDRFTSLVEFIIGNGGSTQDTLILAALQTPEVIDFALPIAILISIYFAVQNTRDNNELVVCAAAGISWTYIPRFALIVGVLGMVLSLLFSTVITPVSVKASRIYAQALEGRAVARAVTNTTDTSAVRTFHDRTFIASPSSDPDAERGHIFVFQRDDGNGWRASTARDWKIEGPRNDGTYAMKLIDFNEYVGRTEEQEAAKQAELDEVQRTLQGADFDVRNLALTFRLEDLVRPVDRSTLPHERVMFLATLRALWVYTNDPEVDRQIGAVISRAIGCLWAAMLAVAAVGFSNTSSGRYIAVPLAIVAVMGGDIVFRTLIFQAAALGTFIFIPIVTMLATVAILLPFLYLLIRREAILIPRRGAS